MNDLAVTGPSERAHFLRVAGRPELEAVHATFVRHRYPLHTHETLTIALVERGAASFELDGRSYVAPAGSAFVIPPRAPHTGESAAPGGYTYKVLYVDPEEAAAEIGAPASRSPSQTPVVIESIAIAVALARLHRALTRTLTGLGWDESLTAALVSLRQVVTTHASSGPSRRRHVGVRRARTYLDEHFTERVYLAELAREAGLSPYHLTRTFHAELGMPPSAYQRQLRIELAKRELRGGIAPARVAADCGFSDQAHLTRQFKQVVGVPPGAFAAAG